MATVDISRFILKKQGLVIPEIILKQEFITEFEKTLQGQSPLLVAHFLKKVADNVESYIDIENINKVTGKVSEMNSFLSSQYGTLLTDDDIKILNFISQMQKNSVYDFLEIAGPLYFGVEIIDELERKHDLYSDKIKVSSSLWLFGAIFEQILHMVDRRIYHFLNDATNSESIDKFFKSFKEGNREQYHEHATSGKINRVLSEILSLNPKTNLSIFGSIENPKNLRNKISHSNLFYDSVRNKIICLDGSEYEIDEFIREFYRLFQFLFEWIRLSINKPMTDPQFSDDVITDFKSGFYIMYKSYKREHRFYANRRLSALVIWIEKEIQREHDNKF
jgi:hypothetical protein